jgi:hypothetical protein
MVTNYARGKLPRLFLQYAVAAPVVHNDPIFYSEVYTKCHAATNRYGHLLDGAEERVVIDRITAANAHGHQRQQDARKDDDAAATTAPTTTPMPAAQASSTHCPTWRAPIG